MDDDFTEFLSIVGKEVPCYGTCQSCGDLFIRDPAGYSKPKLECDPERIDNCSFFLPCCDCRDGRALFSQEEIDNCTFPDCDTGRRKNV